MPAVFEGGGVRFQYPENWTLEQSPIDEGFAVTVQSPETAFMLVNIYPDRPEVDDVLNIALDVLRQEYPEFESEAVGEKLAKRHATGYDVQFFSMDLTNSAWLRGLRTDQNTILILCQTSDLELEKVEPVFRAMRHSMELV